MAQIQRKKRIDDTLDLLDETGEVCYTIPVSIDLDRSFVSITKARREAALAEQELRSKNTAEAIEAYGKAICELFTSVFGEPGTEKIVQHYEGNYSEMLLDILPYLLENVFPKIDALSSERLQQAVALRKAVDSRNMRRGATKKKYRR